MAPPRLLIATHEYAPFAGGIAVYAEQMARAAALAGAGVTVLAPAYDGIEPSVDEGLRVLRFPGAQYTLRNLPALVRRIADAAHGHDVVHAVDWGSLLAAVTAKRLGFLRTPILATLYGTEAASLVDRPIKSALGLPRVIAGADDHVAISEFTRTLASRLPGMAARPIRVTPLGVDPFWFTPQSGANETSGEVRLLTVARLDPRKGHLAVLAALRACSAEVRERTVYRLVGTDLGDGYLDRLRHVARDSGVLLRYDGRLGQAEVRAAYHWADVVVMPAVPSGGRVEGFGLAYLEAAAQGTPSIASDWGAGREVVRDCVTGWIVPTGDAGVLANVIERLADDPTGTRAVGDHARTWARTFTWQRCAETTYGPWLDR